MRSARTDDSLFRDVGVFFVFLLDNPLDAVVLEFSGLLVVFAEDCEDLRFDDPAGEVSMILG